MGGRGSYSMSNGRTRAKIKLLGASSGVRAHNVGGPRDVRKDVSELAKMAGFAGALGTDSIGKQSMSSYMTAIGRLEKEYGALKAVPTTVAGADGKGFHAAAATGPGGATLILNRASMGNAARHARETARESAAGFKMPTNGKLTSNARYTVTHEYGHLLQNALYQKARKSGYNRSQRQFAAKAYRDISRTAAKKYGATGKSLSKYGKTNAFEAFAESFASLHSGAPTAYGKAMADYLRKNKL